MVSMVFLAFRPPFKFQRSGWRLRDGTSKENVCAEKNRLMPQILHYQLRSVAARMSGIVRSKERGRRKKKGPCINDEDGGQREQGRSHGHEVEIDVLAPRDMRRSRKIVSCFFVDVSYSLPPCISIASSLPILTSLDSNFECTAVACFETRCRYLRTSLRDWLQLHLDLVKTSSMYGRSDDALEWNVGVSSEGYDERYMFIGGDDEERGKKEGFRGHYALASNPQAISPFSPLPITGTRFQTSKRFEATMPRSRISNSNFELRWRKGIRDD
ncbi:hypothetical protein SCHPADRAFT_894133 [Schizopora paradoxa]|uniref:Uncharacterized protein n=1 Tax=Schizopora paradoxa TaxID=27342 RepID=A0A0H2RTD9_9AGAM|nr:hypothetical protein SCHPADRAFT_894133 [Schizopora paradoxa]